MENKLKAALVTLFTLLACAALVYGLLHNVQFLGIIIASLLVGAIATGLYRALYDYFETKSKTNKNNQP